MTRLLATLALLLLVAPVWAQEPEPVPASESVVAAAEPAPEGCKGGTCVSDADLKKMVEVLREKKCLQTTKPTFELDPVTIVVDRDGRIFYSGAAPHPYTVKMDWCNYQATAEGHVDVVAATLTPPIWGFRFRPKAYMGLLPGEAFYRIAENSVAELAGEDTESVGFADVFDAGVMADFLYYDWLNLNAAVGFRSFGGGLGADLTSNFGAYVGYANTWGTWHHNVNVSLWFSFYNPE